MHDPRLHLVETIRDSIIGEDQAIDGPFGPRRVTYADYTASGRSLAFLEDFLRHEVMPLYANTHTETSATGLQTTRFREDARRLIKQGVGADESFVVLFCGSGATGAIHQLIDILNMRLPADLDARYGLSAHIPAAERPVVFIGPYEHHSNELPWRESIAKVVVIDEDADGRIDAEHLARELRVHAASPLKIGSFSAASNVTGIVSDVRGLSRLLHDHGALAFWDYAAAGPYVRIDAADCGPGHDGTGSQDALFLSPHKFIGGPGTPGVLVVRRALVRNRVPTRPGGGTVAYVNAREHRYIADPEHREEGGTPAILESIRAGMVFQLKDAVGSELIEDLERSFVERAIAAWSAHPRIRILGNPTARRLSIVSFVVRHDSVLGRERWLHHNFVVALLNDLFGIQARGGCSCAGPYGHRLLGIDLATSHAYEREIERGCEGVKPGWVRVNFNYFLSETVFAYLIEAVRLIADHGWKLLPQYTFEPMTGVWRHRGGRREVPLSLDDVMYRTGRLEVRSRHLTEPESALADYLTAARAVLDRAGDHEPSTDVQVHQLSEDFESLRRFPLPQEAWIALNRPS